MKVCSWERNSHQCCSAQVSGAYLPLLLYLLQLAKVLQPVSCIKIQMWKTLPVSSLNFFLLLRGKRGGFFFFSSSPSTSFLLWNVSNGQRLTSDWLNSKTISFVLIFLFENSYQFAQGKKWQPHLVHPLYRASGWGARIRGGPMNTFEKKGERLQNIIWFKGSRL